MLFFDFVTVFFHLCYEGAVDLDTIKDPNDRHGLEVQIMEFGQIPKQVFTLPHPKRLNSTDLLCENVLSFQKLSTSEFSLSKYKFFISTITFLNFLLIFSIFKQFCCVLKFNFLISFQMTSLSISI